MSHQEEIDAKKDELTLSVMNALLDHVTSNIRLVSVKLEPANVGLYFVFDKEIDPLDLRNAEEVKILLQKDFPSDTIILHCLRIDSHERPWLGGPMGVFMRKEEF